MKKRVLSGLLITAMLVMGFTVSAFATDLTSADPAGDTSVEAEIQGEDTGEVSYIISIPEKIDFGTLTMPESDTESHAKTVDFEVSAVEINGLDKSTSRVVVLMSDAAAELGKFQITGVSGTNNDKVLEYSVLNSAGIDLTSGKAYDNGYAFAAFYAAGQSISGKLSLEQNQLLEDTEIANWAGDYLGTINFYTTIASIGSYN